MLRRWITALIVAVFVAALVFAAARPTASQDITAVVVTNWPRTQHVEGTVSIEGPVRFAQQVSFRDVLVPPVGRHETTRLVSAGQLSTDGFAHVVLSLQGQVKGSVQRSGDVGAILLPAETRIEEAFNEQGLTLFSVDVVAPGVSARTPWFASPQPSHTVAFQAYDVLLYNATDKSVTVNLFAYLTN